MHIFPGRETKEETVERILLENYNRYYRLAYSYVHNDADASDIVQNGAYKAILNCGSLKKTEYAATWIYRIMLNETFRFLEKGVLVSLEETCMEQGTEDVYEDVDLKA
ncbi:MAG: sigma factor, partial [Roseburia sp.]